MDAKKPRRSPRVTPTDSIAGRTHHDTSVRVVDLSASGALVECDRPAPIGSSLDLAIEAGDGGGAPVSLRARVLRATPTSDGRFQLGLLFDGLPAEQTERLSRIIEEGARVERRRNPRIHVGSDAQLRKEVPLEVVNLGLFGGLFRLDIPLEFESEHAFVFTLPEGEVHARGLVRHCEAWAGPGPERAARARFRLGVEFTELEGADRERVLRYLEERNPPA